MTRIQNNITSAPSKYLLGDSFLGKNGDERRKVTFVVHGPDFPKGPEKVDVVLSRLEWEDGSGNSWNFEGYSSTHRRGEKVSGWFRTDKRCGTFFYGDEPVVNHPHIKVEIRQPGRTDMTLAATIIQPIMPCSDSFDTVVTIDLGQGSPFDGATRRAIWCNRYCRWIVSYE